MEDRTGGPAFPDAIYPTHGMTLRDWFAGQAIVGILASCPKGMETDEAEDLPLRGLSKAAYLIANAMLAERSRQ